MSTKRQSKLALLVPLVPAVVALVIMIIASGPWQDYPTEITGSTGMDLAINVGFDAWEILPYVLLGLIIWFARRVRWLWRFSLGYGVIMGIFGIFMYISIILSDSSTAALGFLFLPAYQLIGLVVAVVVGAIVQAVTTRSTGSGATARSVG